MSNLAAKRIVEEVFRSIDIPESAYEAAKRRYEDLGQWLNRSEAYCSPFDPQVYPQGSFRLGTVIRPITSDGEYDLDLGCRLRRGITKQSHTQKEVKHLLGADIAAYRRARGINKAPEEMRRCWRLKYADELSFHLDAVPSIPEDFSRRRTLKESMVRAGVSEDLASNVALHTGAITDNQSYNYARVSDDWRVSNSEGYARWFESRMKLAAGLLQERAAKARAGQVDELPTYRWKSPLQASVQLLKRHRDIMFANHPDGQPISIIITTLAGRAYQGETDTAAALGEILRTMDRYINASVPRVPNPVNPAEDFADKWGDPRYRHLDLEGNFRQWLAQARLDFDSITGPGSVDFLVERAGESFGVKVDSRNLSGLALGSSLLAPAVVPSGLSFPPRPVVPSKPAGFA
jgi:hypothetical protein